MLVSPIRSIRIVESLAATLLRKCADFRSSSLVGKERNKSSIRGSIGKDFGKK